MSRSDLLGRIARARAQMMLRGHHLLVLEIGPETLIELGQDERAVMDWPEMQGITTNHAMEGFALFPKD